MVVLFEDPSGALACRDTGLVGTKVAQKRIMRKTKANENQLQGFWIYNEIELGLFYATPWDSKVLEAILGSEYGTEQAAVGSRCNEMRSMSTFHGCYSFFDVNHGIIRPLTRLTTC